MENVKTKSRNKSGVIQRYMLLILTLIVCAVFTVLSPTFIGLGNITNIVGSTVVLCIASLGLSLVMITGEIDFACGSELAAGACITAVLASNGVNYFVAVLVALVFCALIGVINGLLHTRIGIPGFIATMGVSFVLDGFNKMDYGKHPYIFNLMGRYFYIPWTGKDWRNPSGFSCRIDYWLQYWY